jgi:L-histidine Nalpha-methyltransferase
LKNQFAKEVENGLDANPQSLPTKFIYDKAGSALFEKIMALPEYYLTRSETQIFEHHKTDIGHQFRGNVFNLIELGAGNGEKTAILIEEFIRLGLNFNYVPVDISDSANRQLTDKFAAQFPDLKINPLNTTYFLGLDWIKQHTEGKNLILFLGSNIGNFARDERDGFLRELRENMNTGDLLLIGIDLKKPYHILHRAYNDSKQITAEFNINLLHRINNELDGNFDVASFRFYSHYNPYLGGIEAFLYPVSDQKVTIGQIGKTYHFKAWEPIHTEYSFKYSLDEIKLMANQSGFSIVHQYFDPEKRFVDSLWLANQD